MYAAGAADGFFLRAGPVTIIARRSSRPMAIPKTVESKSDSIDGRERRRIFTERSVFGGQKLIFRTGEVLMDFVIAAFRVTVFVTTPIRITPGTPARKPDRVSTAPVSSPDLRSIRVRFLHLSGGRSDLYGMKAATD